MRICKLKTLLAVFYYFVLSFFLVQAASAANVVFTQDTIIDLSGLDRTLYALSGSQCDSISISGGELTVTGIPDGGSFILATADHNVLR